MRRRRRRGRPRQDPAGAGAPARRRRRRGARRRLRRGGFRRPPLRAVRRHPVRPRRPRTAPAAVRALGGAAGDELARLLPADDGRRSPDGTRASAGRLYPALRALLTGLAARRPLLLVVEDLHWSDRATRDLLGLLAHRLPPRTLLLLTARTDEADDERAVQLFLAQLAAAGAHRLELRPFTRDEQALQLSGIVGIPPTRARLDAVYARAEGNPFFAEELVALGSADVVPVTVRDLLEARIDTLPSRDAAGRARGGGGGTTGRAPPPASAPSTSTSRTWTTPSPGDRRARARPGRRRVRLPPRAAARDRGRRRCSPGSGPACTAAWPRR